MKFLKFGKSKKETKQQKEKVLYVGEDESFLPQGSGTTALQNDADWTPFSPPPTTEMELYNNFSSINEAQHNNYVNYSNLATAITNDVVTNNTSSSSSNGFGGVHDSYGGGGVNGAAINGWQEDGLGKSSLFNEAPKPTNSSCNAYNAYTRAFSIFNEKGGITNVKKTKKK